MTNLEKERAALGHFNVADLTLLKLKAVLAAAAEIRVPVLAGASEGERDFFGTQQLAAVVKSLREVSGQAVFLNVDHTHSLPQAVEAVKAGLEAVVTDFSGFRFDKNVSRTKEAVEALKAINASVVIEGEIGDIGTGFEVHDTAEDEFRKLSTPEEARQFVTATGVDVLAPAVGKHARHANNYGGRQSKEATECPEKLPRSRRPPEYFSRCKGR